MTQALDKLNSLGIALLGEERFSEAETLYGALLDLSDAYAPAYLGVYMAKNALANQDALIAQLSYLDQWALVEDPMLSAAYRLGDSELQAMLKAAISAPASAKPANNVDADAFAALGARIAELAAAVKEQKEIEYASDSIFARKKHAEAVAKLEELEPELASCKAERQKLIMDIISAGRADLLAVGDRFNYGNFPQDSRNASPSPISWHVISDSEGYIVALADKLLEIAPMNNRNAPCTWGSSYLKGWLNTSFLNSAFSASERVHLQDVANSGKVSILTYGEYRITSEDIKKTAFTKYVTEGFSDSYARSLFWLRNNSDMDNLGCPQPLSAFPFADSFYSFAPDRSSHVYKARLGVRPVIRFKRK